MRKWIYILLIMATAIVLTACGTPSKEDVMKKLSGKWDDSKGYEIQATMEVKTGTEPRVYDVNVWHTKPDFYRVNVTQEGSEDSQMIVRNEEGVFVVTPSLGKTYKFQSDWPSQNSQAYLIGALSEDIKADKNAVMTEKDKEYIFETSTRNNHKKVLPTQKIQIDKKTLLPKRVTIFNESLEEQIIIDFKKITLGSARKAQDYAVQLQDEEDVKEEKKEEKKEEANEEQEQDENENNETGLVPQYPTVNWVGVTLLDEEMIQSEQTKRSFMTYGGAKEYTIVQEKASRSENKLPVAVEGDPVDLGFTVAAITDKSIRWENDGISFFIASNSLTQEELIEVAISMSSSEMK